MTPDFHYERGYPEGWTDDLGIIADQNQWVPGQEEGWYWREPNLTFTLWYNKLDDIATQIDPVWRQKTKKDGNIWYTDSYVYVRYKEDVMWFKMLW